MIRLQNPNQFGLALFFAFTLLSTLAAESLDPAITVSRRTGAYATNSSSRLMGFFPAGSSLRILNTLGGFSEAEYVSPSGKKTRGWVRRSDLGLPAAVDRSELPLRALGDNSPWVEKKFGDFDDRNLSDLARAALEQEGFKWRHAETPHYVLHFEHGIFARKVARIAEFYYDYIAIDLNGPQDRYAGRSHILIYRTPERWMSFMKEKGPKEMQWAFAFVNGPTMYLQQAKDTRSSAGVLAHEMTHLILNRFFERQPPPWLNEGLAEWYGEFAYSSYKGTKKSRRTVFQPIKSIIPLETLMHLQSYPADRDAVTLFYQTSKYLVGYLRIRHPEELFQPFMTGVLEGQDPWSLIQSQYGYEDIDELTRKFKTFAHFK
jgi:hypothetical protein